MNNAKIFDWQSAIRNRQSAIIMVLLTILSLSGLISSGNILYAEELPDLGSNFEGNDIYPEIPDIAIGYTDDDTHPETKSIGHWGYKGAVGFDYLARSMGIDLGAWGVVKGIKLIASKENKTRLKKSNLLIYFSRDNRNFTEYKKDWVLTDTLEEIDGQKGRILILDDLALKARYIKIYQTYNDKSYTFVNAHFQKMVKVYGRLYPQIPDIEIGYTADDTHPETKSIGHWGYKGAVGFDYLARSIGIDLGTPGAIKRIELIASKEVKTRLKKSNLAIYFSQDNRNFTEYKKDWVLTDTLEDLDGQKGQILILDDLALKARYIKIHQTYNDKSYTFVNRDLQKIVKVYGQLYPGKKEVYNPDTGFTTKVPGHEGGFSSEYTLQSVGTDLETKRIVKKEEEEAEPPIVKTHSPKAKRINRKFFLDVNTRYEDNIDLKPKDSGLVKNDWLQEIGLRSDLNGNLGGKTKWLSGYKFYLVRYEGNKSKEINTHYLKVNLHHKWPGRISQLLDLAILRYDRPQVGASDYFLTTASSTLKYDFAQNSFVEGNYFWRSMDHSSSVYSYTGYTCMIKVSHRLENSIISELRLQFQPKKFKELLAKDELGKELDERAWEKDYNLQVTFSHDRTKGLYRRVQGSYAIFKKESNSLSKEYQSNRFGLYGYCAFSPKIGFRLDGSCELRNYSHSIVMKEWIGRREDRISYLDLTGNYSLKKWKLLSLELGYTLLANDSNNSNLNYVNNKYTLGFKIKL